MKRHAILCLLAFLAVVAVSADDYTLHLGDRSFDPLAGPPAGEPLSDSWFRTSPGADLHLVQFLGPIDDASREDLLRNRLEIVQYIHPFSYIVWGDASAVESARRHSERIRWSGPFYPDFRVLPRWRGGDGVQSYHGLFYRHDRLDLTIEALHKLGARILDSAWIDDRFLEVRFELRPDLLSEAASLSGTYTIQPTPTDGGLRSEMSSQVNVNNVNGSNFAFAGYWNWLTSVGLDGSGVTIANVDGGVQDSHPDLVNRFLPCVGDTCSTTSSGHGTHTAGIMAGDGTSGVTDSSGFLRGLGVAPGANLIEQRYSGHYTQAGGMLKLMRQSWQNGALLSGNSWGPAGSPRGYDNHTMQVDIGVRDADNTVAGNQQFTYVLSIMNGNGGTSTQGTPDEAKNLFGVGSTKMQYSSGAQDPNIDDLSANSAHGPALDGRHLPDLVAPGCRVDATYPTNSYGLLCGTSMASPQVSGAVALFIERHRGHYDGADPSPALVKATFLAAARDLAGHDDADGGTLGHPFDSRQGWGRMDLERVLDPQEGVLLWDQSALLQATGQQWQTTIEADDPGRPVDIMLVWTDAPGHGLGGATPAWNNDLDLTVIDGGSTFRGNHFASNGLSTTGGSADGANNTEGVFLAPGPSRPLTLRVTAANINSDGVPGNGDPTDQDFALACYNCRQVPRIIDGNS